MIRKYSFPTFGFFKKFLGCLALSGPHRAVSGGYYLGWLREVIIESEKKVCKELGCI